MEILNNFSSIYCFITFILGGMFMFTTFCIAAMCKTQKQKTQKQKNKIHFYVARDKNGTLWLYIGKPVRKTSGFISCPYGKMIIDEDNFSNYGLNVHDFDNLKWEDEPVKVFINMED